MSVFALYNIKGGVGKTSAAVNFAWLSAQQDKTLLIDLDPQSASSFYFRVRAAKKHSSKKLIKKTKSLDKFIRGTDFPGLDILPADLSYRNLDLELKKSKNSRSRLRRILNNFKEEYTVIIIDCPPNITLVSENIFQAADYLLIPTIPTYLSELTLIKLIDFFTEENISQKKIQPFFSMVEKRKKLHLQKIDELSEKYHFLINHIPYLSDIEKMGEERMPVCSQRPASPAAQAYKNLWEEINKRIKNKDN
ncbi:MAG: AAA family ATPase [Calditrichaceae bacterium]|nr:AAA family ATPase [Calditrichaceae bacterium]MBN2707811.1 AAA family ATPase [Calditrichaceae bacterium]RQV96264.1 MAG: ParA family protein [Calditrichota bacterium]